jgi:hypothetical protein
MRSFNARTIGYWATTAVVAIAFAAGAVFDLSGAPEVVAVIDRLGYPAYLATLLGFWKGLGVVALLVPRFERLKEWAYAGMFFDLSGAAVSHVAAGDAVSQTVVPLVLLGLVMASWRLRPESRRSSPAVDEAASRSLPSAAFARS